MQPHESQTTPRQIRSWFTSLEHEPCYVAVVQAASKHAVRRLPASKAIPVQAAEQQRAHCCEGVTHGRDVLHTGVALLVEFPFLAQEKVDHLGSKTTGGPDKEQRLVAGVAGKAVRRTSIEVDRLAVKHAGRKTV